MDINYLTIFILQFTNEQFVKVTILSFDEADPSSTFCRRLLVFIFFMTVLLTYRSQTAVLFQRPCCFNSSKPIPFSLSSVADVRRKECPENSSTLGSSRNVAMKRGIAAILFTPIGCLPSLPAFVADRNNRLVPCKFSSARRHTIAH